MAGPPRGTDGAAHAHGSLHNPGVAHETSDINVRAVIWFVVTLVAVAAAIQVAMWVMFRTLDKVEAGNDPDVTPLAAPAGQLPPSPRLQTTPWQDLRVFRAEEDKALGTYGWVDQKAGVARMPIEKAKDLLLQRGLPARAGSADPSAAPLGAGGESNSGRSIPAGEPDKSTATAPGTAQTPPPPAAKKGGE